MTFCRLASNQIRLEYDEVSVCCWMTRKVSTKSKQDIEEYLTWARSINDWVPECSRCQQDEKNDGVSYRTKFNKFFDNHIKDEVKIGEPIMLEVQIDGDCNAACLMCGEHNSTTWKKYNSPNNKEIKIKIDADTKYNTAKREKLIFEMFDLSKIRVVIFLGGEPFKNDFHINLMHKILKENKEVEKVVLNYVSNGSYLVSDEVFQLWKQFKYVQINFSLDGIEDHFNYLRWPLRFDQVVDNMHQYKFKKSENIQLFSSYHINPLNVFYHDRYLEWAQNSIFQHFFKWPGKPTGVLTLASIPPELRSILFHKYKNHNNIINLFPKFDIHSYVKLLNYLEYHDSKRSLNWREVFPEVEKYFFRIKNLKSAALLQEMSL